MAQHVQEGLECTICLDVPASPIHQCSNGHIICGICFDQVERCGLCQCGSLQISILAERLSRQMDFKSQCPNFYFGCRNLIASTQIKAHISNCYYRNVICTEHKDCEIGSVPLQDFPKHLEEKHGSRKCSSLNRNVDIVNNKLPEGKNWPLNIIEKEGQTFLSHSYIGKDIIYFWMTVLADKEEARKYLHELALEKEVDGKKIKYCWTLPVLPFHDYKQFNDDTTPTPLLVAIPAGTLYDFSEKEEIEENTFKYTFTMAHRIL